MSKHFGQPLIVFGECYPNNIYYDQWENGTYFKSRGYFQLWQFESKIANGIEIVTEISGSNQTHPIVSCRQFFKMWWTIILFPVSINQFRNYEPWTSTKFVVCAGLVKASFEHKSEWKNPGSGNEIYQNSQLEKKIGNQGPKNWQYLVKLKLVFSQIKKVWSDQNKFWGKKNHDS